MAPIVIWLTAGALYAALYVWYRGFRRPFTAEEVEELTKGMTARGQPADRVEQLRRFLEADDGRDFVMVNAIEFREKPERVGEVGEGESSQQVMSRYMAYMWPQLLKRACHPVIGGRAAAPALDIWGIEGAENWTMAGLMRYRSRRDLMEISANQEFSDAHIYKNAAMQKTIAFPIAPYQLPTSPLLVVGLATALVAALLHIFVA
jgi:hypothetical protein